MFNKEQAETYLNKIIRHYKVVDKEITDYYKDINFTEWVGKKVYVGADRKFNNLKITIRNK